MSILSNLKRSITGTVSALLSETLLIGTWLNKVRMVSSLKTKIIIAISAILALTIGFGTWINIGYQRAQMENALEDNVLVISNTIERSLSNAMLDGKSKEVQHILEAVGGYHNIEEVKIFSPNGVILKSSKRWMIGRKVDPLTQKWFLADKVNKPIKRRDEGIFSVLFPIKNDDRCFRCHGTKLTLNGVLAVDVSMENTQREVGELSKTMFLWALGVTAILAVSLSLFLTYLVTNPIRDLTTTMEKAERGLEARAKVKGFDDISRLAAAFNSLLMKLEQARKKVEEYHYEQMKRADRLASIGEMAAGIAHEIKNPLAGIAGVIQVLKKEPAMAESKKIVLDEVLSQVDRMDKAVRNLLSFARQPEPKMVLVDINAMISKLLEFLAPQFAKNGIVAEQKLEAGLPWLTLDPDLIQQALINLTLNAIHAMPQGGKFIAETVLEKNEGGTSLVKVMLTDTGKGIAPEDLNKIFRPFFTTRQQGTGLGLAITQRIVEQHSGDLTVTSSPEEGTCFTIILPYLKAQDETV